MIHKVYQPHLSTAQDARAVRTRESLRRALLELLETTAFDQITIRDIATTAGIGYTTFFRHHPTRESLLHEVMAEQISLLVNMALPMLEMDDPGPASLALCRYIDQHRELWSTLLIGGAAAIMREEFLEAAIELARTWPQFERWRPSEIMVILIASSTIELLAWWLRQEQPLPVEEVAAIHERAIVSPAFNLHEESQSQPARTAQKIIS